jgi:hypothetical protein
VILPVEAVYSILAYLKRHREKTGPRSVRFQLRPGQPPTVVLDPWGVEIPSRGPAFQGERPQEIKLWGRRRLLTLARVLPLCEHVEVRLLGSGLPSVWIAHMGDMRLTLALSGWTTNDWTSGANLDLLSGTLTHDPAVTDFLARHLEQVQRASLSALARAPRTAPLSPGEGGPYRASLEAPEEIPQKTLLGSLHTLAKQGQIIYDYGAECYRYRKVMPVALSEKLLGPESPELTEGRRLAGLVKILRQEWIGAKRFFSAKVSDTSCEALFDADQAFSKAKCSCSHFYRFQLRAGPCRHLLALRLHVTKISEQTS